MSPTLKRLEKLYYIFLIDRYQKKNKLTSVKNYKEKLMKKEEDNYVTIILPPTSYLLLVDMFLVLMYGNTVPRRL